MASLVRLTNTPRTYAWGRIGGISAALGWPTGTGPEAELWLGAHPASPARAMTTPDAERPEGKGTGTGTPTDSWGDLRGWEQGSGESLPFLMKLLAAAAPLSLQAHPTPEQARAGFDREEAAGIPLDARERSYKDPHAKPEIVVAVEDGFDALCGFRPVAEVVAVIEALATELDQTALTTWRDHMTPRPASSEDDSDEIHDPAADSRAGGVHETATGVRAAVAWLLSGDPAVDDLVRALGQADLTGLPEPDAELVQLLTGHYPGDPGIAVALMLNRVSLAAGEALWLPAGNIHAHLSGLGVEVMDPSDNVLRGGLTGKHVDVTELLRVLDFTTGPAPRLAPVDVAPGVTAYRPSTVASGAQVPWQLVRVTGSAEVATGSPSIALVLAGEFTLAADDASLTLRHGDAGFVDQAGPVRIEGAGDLYLATTTA